MILFPLLRPEGEIGHRRRSAQRRTVVKEFELFVALRYLRAKRKQAVISVITVISILGVAAGVMALVIALAINNGFRDTLQRNLLGATAHVSILEKDPAMASRIGAIWCRSCGSFRMSRRGALVVRSGDDVSGPKQLDRRGS